MGQLDASIAQLLLPTLQTQFSVSLAAISWVSLGYLLVLAATLPIFGRLADIFGRKLLYTGGFFIFILGSALCGFAVSLPTLIAARVVQAIGAGLLQANSVAIITAAAGPARRGRAIGIQGAAQALGLSLGPALGGLLINALGWRWVFWINVPPGIAGLLLGWFLLPRTERQRHHDRGFDWWGAALLAPSLTLVLLALSEIPNWGGTSARFVGTLSVGMALLAVFIWHEGRARPPLIDFVMFRSRTFRAGNLAGLISYGLLFGVFILLPYVFERGYSDSPFEAGLRLTAVPLALAIAAPFSGAISDRLGARLLTVGGMIVAGLSLAEIAIVMNGDARSLVSVTIGLVFFGAGQGFFTAPNNSSIMGAVRIHHLGAAGGILAVTRTLGTSLGVAIAAAVLPWRVAIYSGHGGDVLRASAASVVSGTRDVFWIFAALAFIAAAISLSRGTTAARARQRDEIAPIEPAGAIEPLGA